MSMLFRRVAWVPCQNITDSRIKYGYIVDKGIWSNGMILVLGGRGPKLNSRNAQLYKLWQKVFEFRFQDLIGLQI